MVLFHLSICIWEIAIKIKNNKLDLGVDLDKYVSALKKSDVVRIIPIDEDIWLKSVSLNWTHRDPADRVLVALAEMEQAAIVTSDQSPNYEFLFSGNLVNQIFKRRDILRSPIYKTNQSDYTSCKATS